MKQRFIKAIPNAFSMGNAFCGLMAILLTTFHKGENPINFACVLIMLGGFLDSMDGLLARKLNATSEIGKQLDSFADLITFGIAPIMIYLSMHLLAVKHILHLPEIVITAFYVVCAIYRLARYNVSEPAPYFEGLPTTASGVLLCLYIFISNMNLTTWCRSKEFVIVSCIFIFILGISMISTFRVNRLMK